MRQIAATAQRAQVGKRGAVVHYEIGKAVKRPDLEILLFIESIGDVIDLS
jgi:hypothetical protein